MKTLFIKPTKEKLYLEKSLTSIKFDNCILFRNFVKNISENIILSENNEIIDINKHSRIIYDPLNLDVKDKKVMTELYKQIKNEISEERVNKWRELEANILNLITDISLDLDYSIDYETEIDLSKLLSLYQVSVKEEKIENFLNYLLNYIKIYSVFLNCNIFISIRLLSLLEEQEYFELESELSILGITLIDFDLKYESNISTFVIDDQWCVI